MLGSLQRLARLYRDSGRIGVMFLCVGGLATALVLAACGRSLLSAREKPVDYNWDVRPILSNNCFRCHGRDAKARKASLRLDQREVATAELTEDKGKFAIVPGSPGKSELIRRITSEDTDVRMPPASTHTRLSAKDIKTLTRWIDEGAEYNKHWAFITPKKVAPPSSKFDRGGVNDIDKFIFARLEHEGMSPAPEADRETLINRVSFTLTGLPPSPEEVDAFVADKDPNAYEKLVDRLLASRAYGERMATEWLDAARFADSDGYLDDSYGRLLYPWRDWVISAFNANLPYDQFGTWQLAGDLLKNPTKEQILATTFGRLHRRTAENGIIDEEYRTEYVIDRTDTTGTAFLGLSVGCARCHDHKFDPISHIDYYSLNAFFNSTDDAGFYPQEKWDTGPVLLMTDKATDEHIAKLRETIDANVNGYSSALANAAPAAVARVAAHPKPAALLAALQKSIADAQVAYYPFDTAETEPALEKEYRSMNTMGGFRGPKYPGLEPSQPLKFSPSGTPGLKPAVLQAPILKKGARGNALFFDANNRGFLDKADNIGRFDHPDDFSVDFWVYPDKVYEEAAIINHSDHLRYGSGGWTFDFENNRVKVQLVHSYPREQITVITRDALPAKGWAHIAMTYDGSARAAGVALFVDGKPVPVEIRKDGLTESILPTGIPFVSDGFNGIQFGKRWQQSPLEGGGLDELRVFRRRLSPIEVDVLHEGEKALQRPDLDGQLTPYYASLDSTVLQNKESLRAVRTELNTLLSSIPKMMVMGDTEQPRQTYELIRGVYSNHGAKVYPRGLVQIFPYADSLPKNRLGLAEWMFDPQNPLTARVYVNRLWQMHFGTGIVRTAEDFGLQGEAPTNPELLDWLACEFTDSKWDVKKINKLIVMSATFRQSSTMSQAQLEKDPGNQWLGRGVARRLTAEMIRDNALAASGLLDTKIGGPSVFPYQPDGVWGTVSEYQAKGYPKAETVPNDQHRRSIYSLIRRGAPVPSMTIFDFPRRHQTQVRRQVSNTPLQALVLLNDPQYVEASRAMAQRVAHEREKTDDQLERVFRLGARRPPDTNELTILRKFYDGELQTFEKDPSSAEKYVSIGVAPVDKSIDAPRLAALASTANVVLNSPDSYLLR